MSATQSAGSALRVVAVTYSPGEVLEPFLDSLEAATTRPVEVVLADNGSTDGVPEGAEARGRARLLHTGGNLGYGMAANQGAAGAAGEWLVVANPDIEWHPGSIDTLLEVAARWPRAGVLGPAILTPEGEVYPSARDLPTVGTGFFHALLGWFWPTNPWTRRYRHEAAPPSEGEYGWLSGSCLLLRREAFEQVGGFDPSYFMFFEDVDLCERLTKSGWQVVYAPAAHVTHVGGHSWRDQPAIMIKAHHASAIRYLTRRYDRWYQAPVRLALRLGLSARYVASRLVGRMGAGAPPARRAGPPD